ncbi:flagellin [Niallia alba]|uniref:flagellin N-terminal helical domain-containing protein n=1 Tax=Niallia alba TaxID=2729105 RepID=UPI00399F23C3
MRINHNIAALNTYNKLNSATNAQSKSMEKLSSGLRINSAADDAAGLAISEKMRGQIRGLDQASRNAQDGISLIQTAEGALSETTDILQRMRELATQAANDTNTTSDRDEIQKEINQLTSEVNRIGNTTEFNTKKLLNGGKEDLAVNTTVQGKVEVPEIPEIPAVDPSEFDGTDIMTKGVNAANADVTINGTFSGTANETLTLQKVDGGWSTDGGATTITLEADDTFEYKGLTIDLSDAVADGDLATGDTWTQALTASAAAVPATPAQPAVQGEVEFKLETSKLVEGQKLSIGDNEYTYGKDGDFTDLDTLKAAIDEDGVYTAAVDANTGKVTLTQVEASDAAAPQVSVKTGENFSATLQIGANESQSMKLEINDMRADALKLTGTGAGYTSSKDVSNGTDSTGIESGLDVSTAANAASAITTIQSAIDTVSAERSKLGAYQNRLDHTINNLSTSSENLTAAESRIRDVDYALAA